MSKAGYSFLGGLPKDRGRGASCAVGFGSIDF